MGNIEELLVEIKESLEREIGGFRYEMREGFAQINTRLDTQSTRLERRAGLWQAGTRWSSPMDTWAEKIDAALEAKELEIAELRERVSRLEKKSA